MDFLKILLVVSCATLCGCGTVVSKFYDPVDPGCETVPSQHVSMFRIAEENTSGRKSPEMKMLLDLGYVRIGNCSFETSEQVTEAMFIQQALKVGASAVVYYACAPETKTINTVIPIYNQGQTYNSTFSGYGQGGAFSGTVTTVGPSSLSVMPAQYTTTTQIWVAAFMAKKRSASSSN